MKTTFFLFLFIILSNTIYTQVNVAYSGTIFVDGSIISSSDSSAFSSISATGRGIRTVFDRRTSNWNSINAILFKIVWNDGLTSEVQVNPEFGDSAAQIEAKNIVLLLEGFQHVCAKM